MDYRKIGQGLKHGSSGGHGKGLAPNLRTKPLAELGLTGLVERLAMAIRESKTRE